VVDSSSAAAEHSTLLRTAYECAVCSKLAYFSASDAISHAATAGVLDCTPFEEGETQGALFEFPEYYIIAFRGTTHEDIDSDLRVCRVAGPDGRGLVHRGFYAYTMAGIGIVELLLSVRDPGKPVIFAGHSLGGAAATLAAAFLITDQRITNRVLNVFTFGSPRVGDAEFARLLDEIVGHQRFVNANDGVAYVPWLMGLYRHCGNLHYITTGKQIWHRPCWLSVLLDRWGGFKRSPFRWATDKVQDHWLDRYIHAIAINLAEELPRSTPVEVSA